MTLVTIEVAALIFALVFWNSFQFFFPQKLNRIIFSLVYWLLISAANTHQNGHL